MRKIPIFLMAFLFVSLSWGADTLWLLPDANGTTNQWSTSGAGEWYECVDDPIGNPDDDDTYVYENATDGIQEFNHATNDTLTGKTILNVRMYARMRKTSAQDADVEISFHVGDTVDVGDTITLTTDYVDYTHDWSTNPDDGEAWEKTDIDGLQTRLKTTGTYFLVNARCTQVYLAVAYESAVSLKIMVID